MRHSKIISMAMAGVLVAGLTACGGNTSGNTGAASSEAESVTQSTEASNNGSGDQIVVKVAYENSNSEPIGMAWEDTKSELETKSNGTMVINTYPDSQLGDKSSLIDSMMLGENVVTLADGAFYADYGQKDMGILFGPFLFDNWDQCWTLIESDWYKDQCKQLEDKGLHILASNWKYGTRNTITNKPVHCVDDLAGLKIRVPSNEIQTEGFNILGATATGMPLNEVYQALQTGTIDGAENPLSTLYGQKQYEVAPYIILDGHVLNFTTWVCSADWYNSLTEEQQQWLTEVCEDAGNKNNEYVDSSEEDYKTKLEEGGATIYQPTEEELEGFKTKAEPFYDEGNKFGWSDGLYDTVKAAMGN